MYYSLKNNSQLVYGPNKDDTDFVKQEIILKIVRGTKIILHEDQQYSRDVMSVRIN